MTAKAPQPMPEGTTRPPAPAAPPTRSVRGNIKPPPPSPPPMRVGIDGDTAGWDGVRRKADGSVRNFTIDRIRAVGLALLALLVVAALVKFWSQQ